MGYVVNDHIIVSGWKDEHLKQAHDKAVEIFGALVSPMISHTINNTKSFYVSSSGSKSGWSDKDAHLFKIHRYFTWSREANLYNEIVHVSCPEEIEKSNIKETLEYVEAPEKGGGDEQSKS